MEQDHLSTINQPPINNQLTSNSTKDGTAATPTGFAGLGEDGVSWGEGALQPRAHPHTRTTRRRQARDGGGQRTAWGQGRHGSCGVDGGDHSAKGLQPRVNHALVMSLQSGQVVHGIHCNKRSANEWQRNKTGGASIDGLLAPTFPTSSYDWRCWKSVDIKTNPKRRPVSP